MIKIVMWFSHTTLFMFLSTPELGEIPPLRYCKRKDSQKGCEPSNFHKALWEGQAEWLPIIHEEIEP